MAFLSNKFLLSFLFTLLKELFSNDTIFLLRIYIYTADYILFFNIFIGKKCKSFIYNIYILNINIFSTLKIQSFSNNIFICYYIIIICCRSYCIYLENMLNIFEILYSHFYFIYFNYKCICHT